MRAPDVRELLAPARALEVDAAFWREPSDGAAVFCSPGWFRAYRLPESFPESAVVSSHYCIKPLLPLAGGDGRYHVLAVSQNQVKLYEGTRCSLEEVELDALPKSLAEALNYQQPEGLFQVRSGNPAVRGRDRKESAVFHGQGSAEHEKDDLRAYFRQIDKALHAYLREHGGPLLFAGVEALLPIYREANSYPLLVEEPIGGNPALLNVAELQEQAAAILAPYWERTQERDANRIRELAGSARVSADVEQIVVAAVEGRVDALFVAADVPVWGRLATDRAHVELLPASSRADDLLDYAAREALARGARVYAVRAKNLPAGLVAAALFRYAIEPSAVALAGSQPVGRE
jgi:hypothetical protein